MTFLESFLRPTYTITEQKAEGIFSVDWVATSLPPPFEGVGILFLVLGLSFIFFRPFLLKLKWIGKIGYLGKSWFWNLVGGLLSSIGVVVLLGRIPNPPLTQWQVSAQGLKIQFPEKQLIIPWKELEAVNWDTSQVTAERAPLLLTYAQGKKIWLAFSWLLPTDRHRFLQAMAHWNSKAVRGALEDPQFKKIADLMLQ